MRTEPSSPVLLKDPPHIRESRSRLPARTRLHAHGPTRVRVDAEHPIAPTALQRLALARQATDRARLSVIQDLQSKKVMNEHPESAEHAGAQNTPSVPACSRSSSPSMRHASLSEYTYLGVCPVFVSTKGILRGRGFQIQQELTGLLRLCRWTASHRHTETRTGTSARGFLEVACRLMAYRVTRIPAFWRGRSCWSSPCFQLRIRAQTSRRSSTENNSATAHTVKTSVDTYQPNTRRSVYLPTVYICLISLSDASAEDGRKSEAPGRLREGRTLHVLMGGVSGKSTDVYRKPEACEAGWRPALPRLFCE